MYPSMAQMVVFPHSRTRMHPLASVKPHSTSKSGLRRQHTTRAGTNFCVEFDGGAIDRIREKFGEVKLSISSYDTAWVAMVPAKRITNVNSPCFPQCLDWILENQNVDGSWSLNNPSSPSLVKDSLSSTMACILALQKWKVGHQLITKGLDFIKSKELAIYDKRQSTPIGFDIVFPGMIEFASNLGLNIPLDSTLMEQLFRDRESLLKRNELSYFGYIGEGMNESFGWKDVMRCKQANGSLFSSPATTAASQIYLHDDESLHYLKSVLDIYGMAAPAVHPFNIYTRLSLVDNIEKLGIARYFVEEIESVLNETFSHWQQHSEEIFMDVDCLAMAFRLLRLHSYPVQSDVLAAFVEKEHFFNTVGIQSTSTKTIMELYKASEVTIYPEEPILDKMKEWTSTYLKNRLVEVSGFDETLYKQVENTLEHSINTLDRVAKRRSIELHDVDEFRMLKTPIWSSNINDKEQLIFSIYEFNNCQAIMKEEIHHIEKWVKESNFNKLIDDHQTLLGSHFVIGAEWYEPEFSDARVVSSKGNLIATFVDDMFDIDGSKEELSNLMELVQRWDEHSSVGYSSQRVHAIFLILYNTINEYADKVSALHGRSIKYELVQIWVDYLDSMMKENEWWTNNITPSLQEHVVNGARALGGGLYLAATYFLGTKLSPKVVKSEELKTLFNLGCGMGRLFNDSQGYLREGDQKKVNSYEMLIKMQDNTATAEEDAKKEFNKMIEERRRELLRMLLNKNKSCVPLRVRKMFWSTSKIARYVYTGGDQFRCPTSGAIKDVKAMIYEPILLPPSCQT